jgi:hypothetical protein
MDMSGQDRRQHPRCVRTIPVRYAFLNQSEEYSGTARNYSRFGMYFETTKHLEIGTMLTIRPQPQRPGGQTPVAGGGEEPPIEASPCDELKYLVVAQIKHRTELQENGSLHYGVGVHFVGPAV